MIFYKSGKSNPIDAPSKRPNYKNENEFINKFLFILQQKLVFIKKLTNPLFKIIKTIYGRGSYDSYIKWNYNVPVFPLMGIATVFNGETIVDQKATFITKFVYGHGACGSFLENNRNVAVFSLIGNVAVSSEKKIG